MTRLPSNEPSLARLLALALALALGGAAGCPTSSLGTCAADADCKAGSRCDLTQSPPVCVVPEGACFPLCTGGKACKAGACVDPICTPACSPTETCDTTTATCVPATAAEVQVTSPAANAGVGPSIPATASAHAPGGVSAVRFELRRASLVLATADGAATPSAGDPANWAATLSVLALAGPANLVAIATFPGGTKESAAVPVTVNGGPPALALVTDGRTAFWKGGATATIKASLTPVGGGVVEGTQARVVFTAGTHAPLTATVAADGTATFTVVVDDALGPDGQATSVPFRVEGTDTAGNTAALADDPKAVLQVDRKAPEGAIAADTSWHAASGAAVIAGTASDAGGSLAGGAAKVELLKAGTVLSAGTLTAGATSSTASWSVGVDLASIGFGAAQGTWTFDVRLTDHAGNTRLLAGSLNVDGLTPLVALMTDGRLAFWGGGATATVQATFSDGAGGSGVAGTQARLVFTRGAHAPLTATVAGDGSATFSVLIDDVLGPAGQVTSTPFRLEGQDGAGNPVTLTGDPKAVLQADRVQPSATLTADASWHAHTATVAIAGTASDPGGSLSGGLAKVEILKDGAVLATGAAAASWSVNLNLAGVSVGAIEGAWAFQARVTDAAGNSRTLDGSLNVDALAPRVTNVTVTTAADLAQGPGYYKGTGAAIAASAAIQDPSGIDPASVCLRLPGEAGACQHTGIDQGNGTWTFSFPRPGASPPLDGSTPYTFTVSAADLVASQGSGHVGSGNGGLYFDNVGPAVAIPADATVYPRTLAGGGVRVLSVAATITDLTGVVVSGTPRPALAVGGNTAHFFTSSSGTSFAFDVSAAEAIAAGTEAAATITVTATDGLGNLSSTTGTRAFDDAPPSVALLNVSRADGSATSKNGIHVQYPTAIAGTGWDGAHFVYSDTVRLQGRIEDLSGVAASSTLRVNGRDLDGNASIGSVLVACPGGPSCPFDVVVTLNSTSTGEFHVGTSNTSTPSGNLTAAFALSDLAAQPDGTPAMHTTATSTPFGVTRIWWFATLPNLDTVNGLVIHPDGDLVITGSSSSTADTVRALWSDGPIPASGTTPKSPLHWGWGASAGGSPTTTPIGAIADAAAVGAGTSSTALIYVASVSKSVAALQPNGTPKWLEPDNDTYRVAPAIADGTITPLSGPGGAEATELVLLSSNDAANASYISAFARHSNGTNWYDFALADDTNDSSSPIHVATSTDATASGWIFVGNANSFSRIPLLKDGSGLGTVSNNGASGPFWSPLFDGTNVLAIEKRTTAGDGRLRPYSTGFAAGTQRTYTGNRFTSEGALDINSNLLLPADNFSNSADNGALVQWVSGNTFSTVFDVSGNKPWGPLVGSEGTLYLPRQAGVLYAIKDGKLSWMWDPNPAIHKRVTMDCNGHLFAAAGNEVRAFITDDKGLGDSPWPAGRRDSRNTGNVAALKYGMRLGDGSCTQ